MAYQELVKTLDRMRGYLREFYVYGFKTQSELIRTDVRGMNARSNDYIRQRVDSWLGGAMTFQRGRNDEPVFLSADSRQVAHNPLYAAFHAKSFTDNDLTQHFLLMALLSDGKARSVTECADAISALYDVVVEVKTLRKKLDEYAGLGLLTSRREGKTKLYALSRDDVSSEAWQQAIAFFAEAAPLGVIGSYFSAPKDMPFAFKNRYLQGALDSDVLLQLLQACEAHSCVQLTGTSGKKPVTAYPVRVYISVQTGRQFLLYVDMTTKQAATKRIDRIESLLIAAEPEQDWQSLEQLAAEKERLMWGIAAADSAAPDHVELHIHAAADEGFIERRLMRERRHGQVEHLDVETLRFTIDVCDAMEMVPWIRSFTGRITHFSCSDPSITRQITEDLQAMAALYGEV